MLQPIIASLDSLHATHEELLALSTKKREALIQSDLEQIVSINKEESKLLKQVGQQEKERLELVAAFLQASGKGDLEGTLSDIIEVISDLEQKRVVEEKAYNLQVTLLELQEVNITNANLLTDSMHFVQYSLDLFTDSSDQHNYQKNASQSKGEGVRRSIFDTRA
ncbi:flagellar protein FlgN [Bacillus horti]|uniref:Flagellar biosynthesis/type III secretory pathway chaperone n=1 Tax=Caldalkalibacillus horti TaxID=77523 RepID=A0ABT9VZB9_9BACI|nr:flagellar protein FlgN [Bacillus horti]MDQ0166344.1 flagellar biosynthesis/type III secretory pathway chaperone [Bacillus horti]